MNVTKKEYKDRKLHREDYLQRVSAEQKEYVKTKESPYTDPYVRWCWKEVDELIIYLLPDLDK